MNASTPVVGRPRALGACLAIGLAAFAATAAEAQTGPAVNSDGGFVTEVGVLYPGADAGDALRIPEPRTPPGFRGPYQDILIRASEDSFVANGQPGSNFGTDSRLRVGDAPGYGATRTFVYFDFNSLDPKLVVTGGTLRLYQRGGTPSGDAGRDIPVHRVTSSWKEREVNWNNQPSTESDRIDTINLGTGSGWREWNVDRAVVRWYDKRWDNQGLYVQGYEASGSSRDFDSRESSNRPEINLRGAIDNVPPVCAMLPLAPYTNVNPFTIQWQGVDPDPASGIAYYVVWARRTGEPWTVVQPQATTTSATFQGATGNRYEFRVNCVDRAGNQEVPAEPAQAFTLLDTSPPITTLAALPAYVKGPTATVQWTAQDQPVGTGLTASGIAHYDVQWSIAGGPWGDLALGLQSTSFTSEPLTNGGTYGFRVRAVDKAGNIGEWSAPTTTIVDSSPPRSWFLPVSGVDNPDFLVRWTSTDGNGSGTSNYDVQYRVDGGAWQDWVTASATTERVFNGEYGVGYGFRVRATDNVGNVAAYPDQPQLFVRVMHAADFTARVFLPAVVGSTTNGTAPRGFN